MRTLDSDCAPVFWLLLSSPQSSLEGFHMASLYQRTQTKVDPATGKTTKKKLPKWWGKYNDADGITQRVPLSTNKTAAQQLLTDLVKQAEFGKSGLVDPFQHHLKSPLSEHLAGF